MAGRHIYHVLSGRLCWRLNAVRGSSVCFTNIVTNCPSAFKRRGVKLSNKPFSFRMQTSLAQVSLES